MVEAVSATDGTIHGPAHGALALGLFFPHQLPHPAHPCQQTGPQLHLSAHTSSSPSPSLSSSPCRELGSKGGPSQLVTARSMLFPDVRHASADLASHMRLRAHDEPGVLATDGSLLIFPAWARAFVRDVLSNPMGAEASSEQTCSAIRNSALRVAVYARQN